MPSAPESFPDVAAANAEAVAKLESQGAEVIGVDQKGLVESGDALDALAATITENHDTDPGTPAASGEPVVDPAVPVIDPAVTAEAERIAAEKAEALKKSEEYFKDSPALPSGASPKSTEAFSAIKVKAAQEIAARDQKLADVQKQLEEAQAKLTAGPDPEVLKELEDHRQWRAKLDVDADPKFRGFDKQISASHEFIYAQLKRSPAITGETIEQIKKLGGPENVNLEKIFAAVKDPGLQRIIEAKVADIEMAKFNKEEAIKSTKANISKYVAEREAAFEQGRSSHNKATETHVASFTAKLPWFVEKPVDAKADEPTRKATEAHNAFVKETRATLSAAMKDDTAEMRAIMVTGMAQLLYLQRARTSERAELAETKKALEEAKGKLAKFTGASVSRLRETGAAPGQSNPVKSKDKLDLSGNSSSALDDIAKQVTEEKARKASA